MGSVQSSVNAQSVLNSVSNTSITANTTSCHETSDSSQSIKTNDLTINCKGEVNLGDDDQETVIKPDQKCVQANTTTSSFSTDVSTDFKSAIEQAASGVNITPSIQTQQQLGLGYA